MRTTNFKSASDVIKQIEQAGFQAYIVGGAIRDHLLNQTVNDIDIATSATPQQIQSIFDQVIPVGIEHGTVIVRHLKQSFEVTTFRSEQGYTDFRRPDRIEFVESITTDLSRRDFTINAMAMTDDGQLIDPFNGKRDLHHRLIRAVGDPVQRLTEDPLRMLRAIRFVSQLDFQLDRLTWQEIHQKASLIEKLSIERITVELDKLFQGQAVNRAIDYGHRANLFNHLPIFKNHPELIDLIVSIDRPISSIIVVFSYLSLMTNESISIKQWCRAYRLSNKEKNKGELLFELVKLYKKEQLSEWLVYQLPDSLTEPFILLVELVLNESINQAELVKIQTKLPIKNRAEIQFDGHELISLYPTQSRGSWMKDYLIAIEREIIENRLNNDSEHIKEWILRCHPPKED